MRKCEFATKRDLESEFIKNVSLWNSGGGIMLNLITLKNGKVIAINDEVAVLYDSSEDLLTGDSRDRPSIEL
jgi:hypothetical protein